MEFRIFLCGIMKNLLVPLAYTFRYCRHSTHALTYHDNGSGPDIAALLVKAGSHA